MNSDGEIFREEYCQDCGCVADDEVCPRCIAEAVDMKRRYGIYLGDRRWNGESMSRNQGRVDTSILVDVRETPHIQADRRTVE